MPIQRPSSGSRRFAPPANALWARIDHDIVVLQQDTGRYLGLNEVASTAFVSLAEGSTLGEVHAALRGLYEVDEDALWNDLAHLVDRLLDMRLLIERSDE